MANSFDGSKTQHNGIMVILILLATLFAIGWLISIVPTIIKYILLGAVAIIIYKVYQAFKK